MILRLKTVFLTMALMLAFLFTVPASAMDTSIAVQAPDLLPALGQTFTVSVDISGNPGLGAVQFALGFDAEVLDCTAVSLGTVLKGALSAVNPDAESGAVVAAASTEDLTGNGSLAKLTFRVLRSGAPAFSINELTLCQTNGRTITCTVSGAKQDNVPAVDTTQGDTAVEPPAVMHLFTDTAEHWAETYINRAVALGLFNGYADGGFHPDGKVTRGAFVTVLWRLAGKPTTEQTTPFTDIASCSGEFRAAIAWAYQNGYVSGKTATTFAPAAAVKRQEAAKILFGLSGGKSGEELLLGAVYDKGFIDSDSISAWAKAPMYWAYYNEILSGTAAGALNPRGLATRAQLAKILVNYAEKFPVE